jgi:glycosyltransferase involved in cell wall biosynthesis
VGEAWNKGWEKASGDILGWLGSDDMYESGAISEVVKFFKENPDVYFLVGKCNLIDDRGKKISTVGLRNYDIKKVFRSGINPIPASSAFYRTEVIKKVGFLNPDIQICDFDYWIRVSNVFRIYPLDRVFSSFRIHTSSATGLAGSYSKYAKEMHRLIKHHYNKGFSFSWVIGYLLSVIIDMMRSFLGPSILYYKFLYSLKKIWLTINPFINTRQN